MNCCTRFTLAAAASLVLIGCRENTLTPPASGPVFAVSDGAHSGNPDFFFLPPMFKNPNTNPNFEPAAFNPNLRPAVEICLLGLPALDGTRECVGAPITRFEPSQISVSLTDQLYQVNWRTDLSNLNVANFYRIQVLVGTRVLGFADIDPVVNLGGKQLQNLQTGEFIPLVDGRTLPIKFRIEAGALCAVDNTPCTSGTINLNTGGTIELLGANEDFKFDVRSGTTATFGGQPVTNVTFNLEVCDGLDFDLKTFGPCLQVSTYFDGAGAGELAFSRPILISMCVLNSVYHTVDETRQEDLITLHQQDGSLIVALPHAVPNCGSGTIGSGARGWGWLRHLAAQLLMPKPAYAESRVARNALLHVGAGGETGAMGSSCSTPPSSATRTPGLEMATTCPPSSPTVPGVGPQRATMALLSPARTVSKFQFALPAMMEFLNPLDADRSAAPGAVLPTAVKVLDWDRNPVAGARVTFVEPAIEGAPTILGTAISDASGVAQLAWTIRAGANTAVATGRGIAAQNNYPGGTVRPFMPDIDAPGPESPVALGTGRVTFTATGGQADLVVTAITHSPADPTDADLMDFSATIQNVGTLAAGPFTLVVQTENESVSLAGLGPEQTSLAPGESVTRCCWHAHRTAGDHRQIATADANNAVPESNEGNNTLSESYFVSAVVYTGDIADPAGDAPAGEPDLISANLTVAGGSLTLRVDFAPGTRANTTSASVYLDVDRSTATGFPGIRGGGGIDAEFLGVEYVIQMGSDFVGPTLKIYHFEDGSFTLVPNSIPISFFTDALEATIPLDLLLGNRDGTLNYKVNVSRQVSPVGFTSVLDDMTDIGQPPGMVVPPIP